MVGGEFGRETGFGIDLNEAGDNEHALLVVDVETQRVLVYERRGRAGPPVASVPFDRWAAGEWKEAWALGEEAA
jgi:hypothetical protein